MADIFVSYAREDRARAEKFVEMLESQGWSVWWDRELGPGSAFSAVIEEQIDQAKCVVVLWTTRAIDSTWVNAEAHEGLARHILIPVLLDDVSVPLIFRQTQASDLIGWPARANTEELESLFAAIANALDKPPSGKATQLSGRQSSPTRSRIFATATVLVTAAVAYLLISDDTSSNQPTAVALPIQPSQPETSSGSTIQVQTFNDIDPGITDEIAGLLARSGSLNVRSPRYATEHGTEDSEFLLQGLKVDDRLVVSLFDTAEQRTLSNFEINLDQTPTYQITRNIARRVARELRAPIEMPNQALGDNAYLRYLTIRSELRRSLSRDDRNKQIAELEELVSLSPRFAEAYAALCSAQLGLYRSTGDVKAFDSAEKHCIRATRLDDGNPWIDASMGGLYLVAGQLDDARASYERALKISRYLTGALQGLARVADEQGDLDRAVTLLREAQSYEPGNWTLYESLAATYFRRGMYEDAAAQYEIASDLATDQVHILNDLGSAYFMQEDFATAIESWRQSVAIEPNYAALSNLGSALFFEKKFEQALQVYEQAIEINDQDYRMWLNCGEAAFHHDAVASDRYFKRAIELAHESLSVNPDAANVISSLASAYASIAQETDSRRYIELALTSGSDDVYVLYDVAVAYARLKETASMQRVLKQMTQKGYPQSLIERDSNFLR